MQRTLACAEIFFVNEHNLSGNESDVTNGNETITKKPKMIINRAGKTIIVNKMKTFKTSS